MICLMTPSTRARWLICMCDMTHFFVWHYLIFVWRCLRLVLGDSFVCVIWLILVCDMNGLFVWNDSFMCVTWHVWLCGMTYSYKGMRCTWHTSGTNDLLDDAFDLYWIDVTLWNVTHPNVWHEAFICVILMNDLLDVTLSNVTHPNVWHESFICVKLMNGLLDVTLWNVTHPNDWHESFICVILMNDLLDDAFKSHSVWHCETHTHVWHDDAYTCVTWRIHMYEYAGTIFLVPMVHWESVRGINDLSDDAFDSYSVWHWEAWLICMCDMTHSHVWHDSSANVALGINNLFDDALDIYSAWYYSFVTSFIRDMIHSWPMIHS